MTELLVICVIGLLVLGPKRLPELARRGPLSVRRCQDPEHYQQIWSLSDRDEGVAFMACSGSDSIQNAISVTRSFDA